ncbi:MAG: hypothetical protein NTX77_07205, partial [Actinobacteria bacterium]|nr:hypothetical protein [Actinomycetota bacterium]
MRWVADAEWGVAGELVGGADEAAGAGAGVGTVATGDLAVDDGCHIAMRGLHQTSAAGGQVVDRAWVFEVERVTYKAELA